MGKIYNTKYTIQSHLTGEIWNSSGSFFSKPETGKTARAIYTYRPTQSNCLTEESLNMLSTTVGWEGDHTWHGRRSSILCLNNDVIDWLYLSIEGIVEHRGDESHVGVDGEERQTDFHWNLLQRIRHGTVVTAVRVRRYYRQHRHSYQPKDLSVWTIWTVLLLLIRRIRLSFSLTRHSSVICTKKKITGFQIYIGLSMTVTLCSHVSANKTIGRDKSFHYNYHLIFPGA